MLAKLLIVAQVAAWLWIRDLRVLRGLAGPARAGVVALPLGLMAGACPEGWSWLRGRRPPPKPKPVDPAAMDGGPVF